MTLEQAIRVAKEVLTSELQRLAVEANLYDLYHLDAPGNRAASNKRKKLKEALEVLAGYQKGS